MGTSALHLCFGYAALVTPKTSNRYAFLEELADSPVDQISIEAAQPKLDLAVVGTLSAAGKTIALGTLDLGDPNVETPEVVASRIRAALASVRSKLGGPGASQRAAEAVMRVARHEHASH